MNTVADIMTSNPITIEQSADMHQARERMRRHDIRHLPVVDSGGQIVGILTHRAVLNHALKLINRYGLEQLDLQESRTAVTEIMQPITLAATTEMTLIEAGRFFVDHKHACLPVLEEGSVVGVVTSMDFVKLSLRLLLERDGIH